MAYTYPFVLPPLPYPYEALNPYIDTETMHYHHDKHFKTYIDKLNAVLEKYPTLHNMTLTQLLSANLENLPAEDRTAIMNNAGGVYNHALFFEGLAPASENKHMPVGKLATMIDRDFGSFENFKDAFNRTALNLFGSGWACLALNENGRLEIHPLKNQETAVPLNSECLIQFDVWEHAYYLKYKNDRKNYIDNLWNVIVFPEL